MKLYIDAGGTFLRSELHRDNDMKAACLDAQSTDLADYIEGVIEADGVPDFIGISFAGQVSGGVVYGAPNLSVKEHALKRHFESRYGLRLEIENDLSCAALAEADARKAADVVALYAGTGLGSGVVSGGKLVRGNRGFAAEIGHVPYLEAPFACGCGKRNCLELYASGSGIAKWLAHLGIPGGTTLSELRTGTQAARDVAGAFETAWLYAAATMVTLYNPEWLVLGGGIVKHNPDLKETLELRLKDYALGVSLEGLNIAVSDIENASMEGAKLLERSIYG